jgi:hypothetical protein
MPYQHITNIFDFWWQTPMVRRVFWISLLALLPFISLTDLTTTSAQATSPAFKLVENAAVCGNRLCLTPNEQFQTGAAWLPEKQPVQQGFEVIFDWRIDKTNREGGADGFAFVIHNADVPFPDVAMGTGRHWLGYGRLPNSLAVEFDTHQNLPGDFDIGTRGDLNDNHLSVQTRGKEPNSGDTEFSRGFTTQTTPAIPDFADGTVHKTRIVYQPGSLAIYLDTAPDPVLTAEVDLRTLLSLDEGKAWVGFTGATGRLYQAHEIRAFSFTGAEAAPPGEDSNNFTAQLDGDQEVPPRETEATGEASFQLSNETELEFTLTVFDVQNLVAAHIHCAPAGKNGAVGVTLFGPMAPGGGLVDTSSTAGTITAPDDENGCGWADLAAVVEAMRDGNAYVNVHTDDGEDPPDTGPGDFPDGELRGQIEAAAQ